MKYRKAKLLIVHNDKHAKRFLTKVLKELQIPHDKLFLSELKDYKNNINNINPKIVIALGKEVCLDLLYPKYIKKSFKLDEIVCKIYDNIIPCYSCSYIINHGQNEVQSIKDCFTLARKEIFK